MAWHVNIWTRHRFESLSGHVLIREKDKIYAFWDIYPISFQEYQIIFHTKGNKKHKN